MLLLATMLTFTACGGDDDEPSASIITEHNYSLYAGATTDVKGESLKNIKWTGDNFVAEVDENAVIRGNKIGYTSIYAEGITSGSYAIRVVVKPHNTSFSEPLLYHNAAMSQIEYKDGYLQFDPMSYGRMPKADMWGIYSSFLTTYIKEVGLPWTLYKKTSDYMMFKTDKVASPYVAYILDKESKIIGAGVYVDPMKSSTLPDFLNERYLIYSVNMSAYTANFAHAIGGYSDNEIIVDYVGEMAYSSSLGMIIMSYVESGSKSRTESSIIMNKLKEIEL